MIAKTYIRTQTHKRTGYIFDGTIECAKNIVNEINKINREWAVPFNLKINLLDDSIHFGWHGYIINDGDLVSPRNDSDFMYEVIEIITRDDLNRLGYQEIEIEKL